MKDTICLPDPENAALYDRLYALYQHLVTVFDPRENPVLETLHALRRG